MFIVKLIVMDRFMDKIICKTTKITPLSINNALKILFTYGKDKIDPISGEILKPCNAVFLLQEIGKTLLNVNLTFDGATVNEKAITKHDIYIALKFLVDNRINASDVGSVLKKICIQLINIDLDPLIIHY